MRNFKDFSIDHNKGYGLLMKEFSKLDDAYIEKLKTEELTEKGRLDAYLDKQYDKIKLIRNNALILDHADESILYTLVTNETLTAICRFVIQTAQEETDAKNKPNSLFIDDHLRLGVRMWFDETFTLESVITEEDSFGKGSDFVFINVSYFFEFTGKYFDEDAMDEAHSVSHNMEYSDKVNMIDMSAKPVRVL